MPDAWMGGLLQAGMTAATGNQDFTTPILGGRTPKGAIFFGGGSSVDHAFSMGATDGTNEFVVACSAEDNVGRPDTKQWRSTADCFAGIDADGGGGGVPMNFQASFVSFIPNGVRLNFSVAPPSNVFMGCAFWGGADLNIEVGSFAASAAAASTDTLNFGGSIADWSALFGFRTPNMNQGNHGGIAMGVVSRTGGNSTGQCVHYSSEDNPAATTASYGTFDDEFLRICDPLDSANAWSISRTGAADTSITFTKDENAFTGSHLFDYVCIDSPFQVKANVVDGPTSTSNPWDITDVGFKTEMLVGFGSAHIAADRGTTQTSNGTTQSAFRWSDLGRFDEGNNRAADDADADPTNTGGGAGGGMASVSAGVSGTSYDIGGSASNSHTRKFTTTGWHVDASEILFVNSSAGACLYCAFQGGGSDDELVHLHAGSNAIMQQGPLARM